jgi:riboflavin synthase
MFTGLVEEVGRVKSVAARGDGATLEIEAETVLEGARVGDSISVAGVCQTVVELTPAGFTVEAIRETMARTRFGSWGPGSEVNLERALRPSDRLGGHLVQGHVDGLVAVQEIRELEGSHRLRLQLPEDGRPYVVEKGSVCLDGISLTVVETSSGWFEVEIIPHTWRETTLRSLRRGDRVHAEWDIIAKYVRNMLAGYLDGGGGGVTLEKLFASGFGGAGAGR